MKKIVLPTLAALATIVGTPTFAGPAAGISVANTPYGSFGCVQRAEMKFFSIGATNIQKPGGSVVWADLGETTVGVWCRGTEAIIVVAGGNQVIDLKNEIKSAF